MRRSDRLNIGLLAVAIVTVLLVPALRLFAQSQEYINGTTAMQILGLGLRIDKIENMINAVLVAMVINFVTQIVSIRRASNGRGRD